MAKIFLDTNIFIDVMEARDSSLVGRFEGTELFVSTVSIGIWTYVYKLSIPDAALQEIFTVFNFVGCSSEIAQKSVMGPTPDYEDNVQLHSAVESECELFITKDEKLIKMGYFGKVRISDSA